MTVLEAIQKATEYFDKKGIESPRINAELLLAAVFGFDRLKLYLSFDRPLSEEETDIYRAYLSRRGKFEPLQYIIGSTEFYGLKLRVNSSVLIPRPETEILVDSIVNKFKGVNDLKILDIGTGSGNIAVSLAMNLSSSKITALDFSEDIINIAKENSNSYSVDANIDFLVCDILSEGEKLSNEFFDIIVSNPPYVSGNDFMGLQNEIVRYEPRAAVTDSRDGYTFYKKISGLARKLLKKGGSLYFEIGAGQGGTVNNILTENNFADIEIEKDIAGIQRVIRGIKP